MEEDIKGWIEHRLERIDGPNGHLEKINDRLSKVETKTTIGTAFGALMVFVGGATYSRLMTFLGFPPHLG